jgi:opacity protein-like surface antigen
MKTPIRFHLSLCGLLLAACTLQAQIPWATDPYSRRNKFEVYGVGEYLHQEDVSFSSPNSFGAVNLKLEDTGMGGVGFAYHFNDYVSIHADLLFGPATFKVEDANGNSFELGNDSFLHSGRFNIDYNIINRRLTPFVTAGIGYQYLYINQDYYSNSGYYYYNYYDETDFTWNVAGGIRWNLVHNLFIKVYGGAQWLEYQNADHVTTQVEVAFAIGATFP